MSSPKIHDKMRIEDLLFLPRAAQKHKREEALFNRHELVHLDLGYGKGHAAVGNLKIEVLIFRRERHARHGAIRFYGDRNAIQGNDIFDHLCIAPLDGVGVHQMHDQPISRLRLPRHSCAATRRQGHLQQGIIVEQVQTILHQIAVQLHALIVIDSENRLCNVNDIALANRRGPTRSTLKRRVPVGAERAVGPVKIRFPRFRQHVAIRRLCRHARFVHQERRPHQIRGDLVS